MTANEVIPNDLSVSNTTTVPAPLKLAPEVLDRLRQLQKSDQPVSLDEILTAANLNHLAQPTASKSADTRQPQSPLPQQQTLPRLEKSTSTLTLAERRRIPVSPEKLKLYAQIAHTRQPSLDSNTSHDDRLKRLEEENAKLPPQATRLERQNALLSADPKSVCIESNGLKANFTTIRKLVTDNTLTVAQNDEQSIHDQIAKSPLKHDEPQDDISDWDFWQCLVDDFPTAAAKLPHLLAAKLRHGGIPHRLRGIIWQAMARSSATNLESIYDRLVEEEESTSSPYDRVIKRDLSRTFPQVEMFKADGGEGQQAMGRLLKAYSVYDAHVGYCQGLAFLVGPLLMTMPEKQAFCVFVRLMETYDMRTMFTLNMEGLHLRLHQFQSLLTQLCPRLNAHLADNSIHPAMYASQWYLTLFAYTFPISLVLRIYDLAFAEGAVETITRVAVAVMQKNEEKLLTITDFEQLMIYLSSRKLYEAAYDSNPEQVIADAMALSTVITRTKLDSIAESYNRELEQEKDRAHQVLAVRFGGWGRRKSKRDSWFSWGDQPASPVLKQDPAAAAAATAVAPASPTTPTPQKLHQDRTVPMLHQQIEDLVTALSQLQKERTQLSEELMTLKMKEMDSAAERNKLAKRNAVLEKRVKKYKGKLQAVIPSAQLSPTETPVNNNFASEPSRLQVLEQDAQFRAFVDSLKLSGDFGTLIAGALSSEKSESPQKPEQQATERSKRRASEGQEQEIVPAAAAAAATTEAVAVPATAPIAEVTSAQRSKSSSKATIEEDTSSLHNVTSELVAVKLASFEMGQKYEQLCHKYEEATRKLASAQQTQNEMMAKMMELQNQLDVHQIDKEQLLQERDDILKENEELTEKTLAAKKTCAELQVEKLALAKDVEALEKKVQELEDERREYLMPRGSFTEEVFAAHRTLFGPKESELPSKAKDLTRRHTLQMGENHAALQHEYQAKYIESDLRCRELEKLLAEAKVKLVEYEACPMSSPRMSLHQQRRASSIHIKRNSTASLSMLASRGSAPTSPREPPPFGEPRESTDSFVSTSSFGSVANNSKRSSMYSRIWNAFGTATPPTPGVVNVGVVGNMKGPVVGMDKSLYEDNNTTAI
ncbi:hypothetical protein EC973_006372 [Apophysomyces ossiformis]|uniref:Rab-GAP TBC domain-containing protein n=1 Tax=Apophysomyces ossiformis TaxID=679940 RepID=A0A8H7BZI6_9FUNG|nr:hypothetical protein EC973_006372 [Apophysomyces ossiformis]